MIEELPVEREEDNQHDEQAVAVIKNGAVVFASTPNSLAATSFEDFCAHSTALNL